MALMHLRFYACANLIAPAEEPIQFICLHAENKINKKQINTLPDEEKSAIDCFV